MGTGELRRGEVESGASLGSRTLCNRATLVEDEAAGGLGLGLRWMGQGQPLPHLLLPE